MEFKGPVPMISGLPLAADGEKRVRRTWKVSEVSEEYAWYELPEWTPREDDVFFVMRGTCDAWAKNFTPKDVPDAVWIDCVEISRVSPMPFSVRP